MIPLHFAYATLTPVSLANHKREMTIRHPGFRLAYSRPGLVTWKSESSLDPDFRLNTCIAQTSGVSIGSSRSLEELLDRACSFDSHRAVLVHARPADENGAEVSPERLEKIERCVEERGLRLARNRGEQRYFDLVVGEAESEPYFLGARRHLRGDPCSRLDLERHRPPERSPSRAYAKLSEALARFPGCLAAGDTAIELGAAPGGAVVRLLEEGLHVVAIDPAQLDPGVSALAVERGLEFVHLQRPAGDVARADLPRGIQWILSDMNLAPPVVLSLVERFRSLVGPTIRGALITVKLNDPKAISALGRVEKTLEKGFGMRARGIQLPSHRSEILLALLPEATL